MTVFSVANSSVPAGWRPSGPTSNTTRVEGIDLAAIQSIGFDRAKLDLAAPPMTHPVRITLTTTPAVSAPVNEDEMLAQMEPAERWRYLARNNRAQFALGALGLLISIYILGSSAHKLLPLALESVVSVAWALHAL